MPCTRIKNGIVCWNRRHRYKGFYFEWHSYHGPLELRKDGMPRVRVSKGFWDAMAEFCKLTDKEKKEYMSAG